MTERERFENLKERAKDDPIIDPTILDAMWDMQLAEIPEIYEKNTWYRYTPNGKICSNGEPYHGSLRVGTENKLMVAFGSGGVSLDEFTAARPIRLFQNPEDVGFYSDDVFLIGDMVGREGILSDKEPNPFKNWSVLFVP